LVTMETEKGPICKVPCGLKMVIIAQNYHELLTLVYTRYTTELVLI
jgi:hypothetical protein